MSQTRTALKNIASSTEYQNLVASIEKGDYGAMASSYLEVCKKIEEAEKEIEQKIQSLARQNKNEDYEKFKSAFAIRARETLPGWNWLNTELQKQKIMEGAVFGVGSKGDPLVRAPDGRVVVITGARLQPGDRVKYLLDVEGPKISFGRVFEFSPDSFYLILNQDARKEITDALNDIRDRVNNRPPDAGEYTLSELGELLKILEKIKEKTLKLQTEERERIAARVMSYRKRLINTSATRMVLDYICHEEEQEIKESCQDLEKFTTESSQVMALFSSKVNKEIETRLFSGEDLKGYTEAASKLESNIESMAAALKYLDFREGIEKVHSPAKRYFESIDRLFDKLNDKARQFSFTLAEGTICEPEQLSLAIKDNFSSKRVCSELRNIFRSPEDFFTMRDAVVELRVKLGEAGAAVVEAALKPYLQRKISLAFGGNT